MRQISYGDAQYSDGGTGISKDTVVENTLLDSQTPRSIDEEFAALSEKVELPDEITFTEIRVEEQDDDTVDIIYSTSDLTVGTQTTRGRHPLLRLRGDTKGYKHFRMGIEAV
jgi:hypothetical protein